MKNDVMEITVLDDGTIKMTTSKVSAPNHSSAAEFFRTVARLSGGEVKTEKRKDRVHVQHDHDHEHEHN
jgi:hypothetical protein